MRLALAFRRGLCCSLMGASVVAAAVISSSSSNRTVRSVSGAVFDSDRPVAFPFRAVAVRDVDAPRADMLPRAVPSPLRLFVSCTPVGDVAPHAFGDLPPRALVGLAAATGVIRGVDLDMACCCNRVQGRENGGGARI